VKFIVLEQQIIGQYSEIFTCPAAELLVKYLGMPIDEERLALSQGDPIREKMEKIWLVGKESRYLLAIE
jgi:hypothetical protein